MNLGNIKLYIYMIIIIFHLLLQNLFQLIRTSFLMLFFPFVLSYLNCFKQYLHYYYCLWLPEKMYSFLIPLPPFSFYSWH